MSLIKAAEKSLEFFEKMMFQWLSSSILFNYIIFWNFDSFSPALHISAYTGGEKNFGICEETKWEILTADPSKMSLAIRT